MQFKILTPLLLLFFIISIQAKCHYTCKNCSEQYYSSCTSCPNNSNFTYVLSLNPNLGTCAQLSKGQANALGILVLIGIICILPMFLEEQMVQLFLFIQTLGLCFLIQLYYNPILDYTLGGCSYLMIISPMTHGLKTVQQGINNHIVKGRFFFGSFSFRSNIIGIGSINLLFFLILILLPIFKNFRRKCVDQRVQFCPDWLIQKVHLAFSIGFIFFIQETVSVIYFSLKYDEFSIGAVLISILYFIILIAFTVNQFFYPLPIFRSKLVQTTTIIGKTVIPMFLLSSPEQHFIFFPLTLTFSLINTIATNKNRNKGKFNRLLFYNIFEVIVLCLLTALYVIEVVSNDAQTSKRLGIVCFVGLFGVFSCVILELAIKIKQKFCEAHSTQSRQLDKDATLQTIEVCEQKQQIARKLSPNLYLEEPKEEFSPKKHSSKNDSVAPEVSEHYPPEMQRSNRPSFERQMGNVIKYQNLKVQQRQFQKKQEPLQLLEQIKYGVSLPEDTDNTIVQNIESNQLKNGSSIMIVGSDSKNKKRLSKLRKDKKSSK